MSKNQLHVCLNILTYYYFVNFIKGLEDSMRRNAVRSIGVETCLFEQKELEQLYAVFKVTVLDAVVLNNFKYTVRLFSLYCHSMAKLEMNRFDHLSVIQYLWFLYFCSIGRASFDS